MAAKDESNRFRQNRRHSGAPASTSHQLHPQLPSDRVRSAGEGAEGDGLIVGVEQPVELGTAGFHAFREAVKSTE